VLVLVSFVLVLAAAVTLVVGLLQSGLTLIYLSIGCSVLAGVVLAVAVLRGRPEPRAAAPVGRSFTPPAAAPPQPAVVGAPASTSAYESTTTFTPPPSPPPPPPPSPAPGPTDDAATKAAGTALLGRLRRRTEEPAEAPPAAATPAPAPEPEYEPEPATAQYAAVSAEADDGFPIADYDRMRATDLLRQLGSLDRNQLEAVRERESAGKNRFTIMSRIDVLLAGMTESPWDAADDGWEDDDEVDVQPAASDTTVIEVGGADEDEFALDDDDWDDEPEPVVTAIPLGVGEMEDDEVDELVSPADDFPIAGYESLTVGQILPRLSDLDADELAQVRAREQAGRARGTILDRIDRLASKSGAAPMPPASARRAAMPSAPARGRKAPARKAAPAAEAPLPVPRKARVAKVTPAAVEPAPAKAPTRRGGARKAAPTESPMVEAVKKASPRKAAAAKKAPIAMPAAEPAKKAPARRKAAAPAAETPMKAAVKKARAAKKQP
jgi:hypothetical protein